MPGKISLSSDSERIFTNTNAPRTERGRCSDVGQYSVLHYGHFSRGAQGIFLLRLIPAARSDFTSDILFQS